MRIGYLFLAISLLACTTKGFCGKKVSGHTPGFRDTALANLVRMGICIVVGFGLILLQGDLGALQPTVPLLLTAGLSGVATAALVVTWQLAVRKSAYMLLDVFMTLGMLIPIVLSLLLFGEPVMPHQWFGLCVLFVAVLIMCSYNTGLKGKMTLAGFLYLLLCGISNGLADFSQKLSTKQIPDVPVSVFNFYTYAFAALALGVFFLALPRKKDPVHTESLGKVFGYMSVMAICLFATSYFKTLAAQTLDAALLYPLNQGMTLFLSLLMSRIFFQEKITVKCIIGIVTAFVGLLIINVLKLH